MTFLLHIPYSNVVGVILAWFDTSIGFLGGRFCFHGGRFHLLAHSRVRYEQNTTVHCFFFKHMDARVSVCLKKNSEQFALFTTHLRAYKEAKTTPKEPNRSFQLS